MHLLSSYLYARPSFVEGIARLIDFGNTLQEYNTSLSNDQADTLALFADWLVVGDDLRNAMGQYKEVQSQIGDQLIAEARKALTIDQK